MHECLAHRDHAEGVAYWQVVVRGTGKHLGIDIGWQVCLRPDGAFVEEVVGTHMSFRWGHDGGRDSNCWEVCGPWTAFLRHLLVLPLPPPPPPLSPSPAPREAAFCQAWALLVTPGGPPGCPHRWMTMA